MFELNLSNQENLLIDQNVNRPFFQESNSQLFYRKNEEFYKYDLENGLELIVDNLAVLSHIVEYPIDLQGNMFIPTIPGLLEYRRDGTSRILREVSEPNSLYQNFEQNNSKTDLIFGNFFTDSLFHYDGSEIHIIENDNLLSFPNLIGDNSLWISDWEQPMHETIGTSIYSLSDKRLIAFDLPRPYRSFTLGEYEYVFSSYSEPRKPVKHQLFSLDKELGEFKLSLERLGNYTNHPFWFDGKIFGHRTDNKYLFRFGDYFIEINEDGDINILNGIREKSPTTIFHSIEGDVYFLAYDATCGRQLYRFSSEFTNVLETESESQEFFIYPNPTHDYIEIGSNNNLELNNATYQIVNVGGKKISEGKLKSRINIQQLEVGIYFFQFLDHGIQYSLKFVKI